MVWLQEHWRAVSETSPSLSLLWSSPLATGSRQQLVLAHLSAEVLQAAGGLALGSSSGGRRLYFRLKQNNSLLKLPLLFVVKWSIVSDLICSSLVNLKFCQAGFDRTNYYIFRFMIKTRFQVQLRKNHLGDHYNDKNSFLQSCTR